MYQYTNIQVIHSSKMRVRERLREACVAGNMSAGTHFTCFTGTKVFFCYYCSSCRPRKRQSKVLTLLALPAQRYKY